MSEVLARLLSDLNVAVFERAAEGNFTLLSESPDWLHNLWPGLNRDEAGLNPGEQFYFLEDFLDRNHTFWTSTQAGHKSSGVWSETLPDGSEQLIEAMATFIDDHPLLLLRVPYHQEIWPIYQQAREQRLEYEQLIDEINKREVLLHCIVHDLSNPLAGIKGSLNLLQSEAMVDEDGDELLKIGLRQATKMQDLIGSILATFANEVKPLVPTLIGMDIAPDVRACALEVVQSLQATASLKGIKLSLGPSQDEQSKVIGESERLERVLYNLLANAIRHSEEGQTVEVHLKDEGDFVYCSVEDEGAGVPEELVDSLFDRFSQGIDHTGQAGLGLYFCKITVEGWGGTIGYTRRHPQGACFWFKLPKPVTHFDAMNTLKNS